MRPEPSHGILDPLHAPARFALERHAPAADLAEIVEHYWTVRWNLDEPHQQETLPFPCVHLVIGTHRPGVHGPAAARFVAQLHGQGWVVGSKFRPGGFRPLVDAPIAELADRELAIAAVFGERGDAVERAVHADAAENRIAHVEAFLRSLAPVATAEVLAANRAVDLARSEPIVRVAELAGRSGLGVRGLERLFRDCVGVSPKWVIRRFRVHEAAERAARTRAIDWARLAHDLGYYDQAHFIRDFKAQIGRTPAEYAAACGIAGAKRRA